MAAPNTYPPVVLIGYGNMGKQIHGLASDLGIEVLATLRKGWEKESLDWMRPDAVAIEFTEPEAAPSNLEFCLEYGLPVVVGTTGWQGKESSLKALCLSKGGAVLKGSNFSPGVNMLFALNRQLAQWMAENPLYRASLTETHHTRKKDAPSGTALSLAQDVMKRHSSYGHWYLQEPKTEIETGGLPIQSLREGDVPGIHTMRWTSPDDCLEIKHEAFGRDGFARGALMAAAWLASRKGWFDVREMYAFD